MKDKQRDKLLELRTPVIDKCDECGCIKIEEVNGERLCKTFIYPDKKWILGNCIIGNGIIYQEDQGNKYRPGQQKGFKKKGKK